jgi:hypothetical protein
MIESAFEGVGGLKIATRAWSPAGKPRVAIDVPQPIKPTLYLSGFEGFDDGVPRGGTLWRTIGDVETSFP